jgi:hypothetical protein
MPRLAIFVSAAVAITAPASLAASDGALDDRPPRTVYALPADVPYAPVDALGLGFASREIEPKKHVVTVTGAAATPLDRLVTIAFARAAEIGLERKWRAFRVGELERTSKCESWAAGSEQDSQIHAGRPMLTITVLYDPEPTSVDVRDSAETFNEMRSRLDHPLTTEQDKQATVDWVLEYCSSTGVTGVTTDSND